MARNRQKRPRTERSRGRREGGQDGLVYGRHVLSALLDHTPERISELWCWSRDRRVLASFSERAEAAAVRWHGEPPPGLAADHPQAQGVAARCRAYRYAGLDDVVAREGAAENTLLLVLDSITDPRNLGAILRSAAFFGVTAVIVPTDRAASITPLVERIARGATATLPVVQVVNLSRTLLELDRRGVHTIGTVVSDQADDLWQVDCRRPVAIALGSEGAGLRSLLQKRCQQLVTLTGSSEMISLNVASFASIALAAAVRGRLAPSP